MKKYLSFLMTMLCSVVAMAQDHWTYDSNTYPDATVVYVKVNEGTPAPDPLDRYEIAAFVDGELRATTRSCRAGGSPTGTAASAWIYTVRVEGDNTADNNKSIEFRLYDHTFGIEYKLSQTFTYNGKETVSYPSNALSLAFNPFNGMIDWGDREINVPKGKSVELPYKFMDVTGAEITDMSVYNKFVIPFEVQAGSPAYFSFDETDNRTVTGISKTPDSGMGKISVSTSSNLIGSHIYFINVYDPLSGVEFNTDKITAYLYDTHVVHYPVKDYITISPAQLAPDLYEITSWVGTGEDSYMNVEFNGKVWQFNGVQPGIGTLYVKVTDKNDPTINFTASVPFEVVRPVGSITVNAANVKDLLTGEATDVTNWFTVTPDNATNPVVAVSIENDRTGEVLGTVSYDPTTKTYTATATKPCDNAVLKIESQDGSDIEVQTSIFKVLQNVTSLTAKQETIYMNEGQTIDLADYYTIAPDDAADKSVTIVTGEWVGSTFTAGTNGLSLSGSTLTAVSYGNNYAVQITSVLNPAKSIIINVIVNANLQALTITDSETGGNDLAKGIELEMGGNTMKVYVHAEPSNFTLDPSKLTVSVEGNDYATGWTYVDAKQTTDELEVTISGKAFTAGHSVVFSYPDNGNDITATVPVKVAQRVSLETGWNWSQPFSAVVDPVAGYDASVETLIGSKLVEMRTETAVLINDPEWGYFGDIDDVLAPSRINVKSDVSYLYYCNPTHATDACDLTVHARWNWISCPYMYARPFSTIFPDNCGADEGDMVKSQEDFAEYSDGEWTGSLVTEQIAPGQSLAYYNVKSSRKTITRPSFNTLSQPASVSAAPRREQSAWTYNSRQFIDNMAIIADIENLDFADDYTVGAFVGEECRGEGKLVKGKWFITVHGEADDVVTLKLMNTRTEDVYDLEGEYEFESKLGTVKSPVRIAAPVIDYNSEATGIAVVGNEIKGNGVRVYTLGGVEVTNSTLAPGTYIVNNGGKVKKVMIK